MSEAAKPPGQVEGSAHEVVEWEGDEPVGEEAVTEEVGGEDWTLREGVCEAIVAPVLASS